MPRTSGVAGLVFDVDGTLIDSNELHAESWREAFLAFGKRMTLERIRPHIGKGGDLLVPDLLNAAEMRAIGKKVQDHKKKLFRRKYLERVRPFPGIRESFERLHAMKIAIVLASSSSEPEVDSFVEILGVADLIGDRTSADDAEFSKPVPEIFEAALAKKKAPRSRTAIVGDTPYDILAAHRAATPIAAVRCGGFPEETLRKAEWLFDDVPDLVKRIRLLDDYFRR